MLFFLFCSPLLLLPNIHPSFVQFFRCESPASFMCASDSHLPIKSISDLLRSPCLLRYAPLLSDIYFQDNKSADCQPPRLSALSILLLMRPPAPGPEYIQRQSSAPAVHNSHTVLLPFSNVFYLQQFPCLRHT